MESRSSSLALHDRINLATPHLLVAIGCAILTGFAELAIMWGREVVYGRMVFGSRHMVWMTPLAYAITFAILGLPLVVMGMVAPRRVPLRVTIFFFVAFGVFCLFLPFPQLHRMAALLLAIGVAIQVTRVVTGRPKRHPAVLARRGALALLAVLLVAAAGTGGWAALRERRALSGLPAAHGEMPNILLIIWDTVRAANLSLHGYSRSTTPALERLARDAVVFELAIAPSSWTLPSHGTMFTGRYPHELSTGWFMPLDNTFPTIAEDFRDRGYATGGFTANAKYTGRQTGLARGFSYYRDYRVSWAQIFWSTWLAQTAIVERLVASRTPAQVLAVLRKFDWSTYPIPRSDLKHAAEVNAEFLDWISRSDGRPFFAFLNYMDAHQPYWSPESYQTQFGPRSEADNRYDAAIAYLDDQIADLLGRLREAGILDNTVVVITSDHGEMFGEHGLLEHGHSLYFRSLHVPLVVLLPGLTEGARVTEPVSLRDLPATLMHLAGSEGVGRFPGTSLSRYWEGSEVATRPILSELREGHNNPPPLPNSRGPMKSVVGRGLHYILNGDGQEELYDYAADDAETINLLDAPDTAEIRSDLPWFREELKRMLRDVEP